MIYVLAYRRVLSFPFFFLSRFLDVGSSNEFPDHTTDITRKSQHGRFTF